MYNGMPSGNQGIPKLVKIWLGSIQLGDSELQECPLIENTSRYVEKDSRGHTIVKYLHIKVASLILE